jgi:hypothetical protein
VKPRLLIFRPFDFGTRYLKRGGMHLNQAYWVTDPREADDFAECGNKEDTLERWSGYGARGYVEAPGGIG